MAQTNILDYIRQTPHNSNVNVVKGMLGNSDGGSLPAVTTDDDGDILTVVDGEWEKAEPGYKCSEETATVFDGNLTTTYSAEMGGNYVNFSTSEQLTADPITVTFDGTEYELPKANGGYGEMGGSGMVFTTYPCFVSRAYANNCLLWTSTAGTYSVKIEQPGEVITTTECFEKAVRKFGLKNIADGSGSFSIVENNLNNNVSSGQYTHTEGNNTKATSDYSHAEGNNTTASGIDSHAEGLMTAASGNESHAEGQRTTASGSRSHAEGNQTTASDSGSHAEGERTTASGMDSHAEGYYSTASGIYSHAEGDNTIANHRSQHVFGEFNVADPSTAAAANKGTYIEIVGCGKSNSNRSNARTLDWNGNEVLQGSLTLGKGTADETTITATQLKALLALLN